MGHKIGIFGLAALAFGLFLTDTWLGFRMYRYSQLIAEHECGYSPQPPCKADFDGDGQLTEIRLEYSYDTSVEVPPRFTGAEPEVVLKAFFMDSTFRTHVAIARDSNHDRLLVYEGRKWPGKTGIVNAVYKRDGNQLVESPPNAVEKQILAAMAARDDTGTFLRWVAYTVLAWPVRFIYIVLFVIAALLYRHYRLRRSDFVNGIDL